MALVYHLDASNPASWANAGTNPEPWTDISGTLVPPGGTPATTWPIQVSNLPTLITDGAVKGLRMISQSGGTYPNGSAILQRGLVDVGTGNPSGGTQLGNLWLGGSYSVQMWIKFNQAPIGGSSNATDRLPTIIWASVISSTGPVIIFGANLADTLSPRANDARIGVQWGAADVTPTFVATGEWEPDVDTWYMATIVCNRSSSTTGTLSLFINDTQSGSSVSYTSTTSPMFEWMGSGGSFTGGMALNSSYSTAATPGDQYFGGDITFSTFKIFNTALSSVDIALQFNDEAPAFGIPTMSTIAINPPYPTFVDRDGSPLENGYIFVGEPNLDPQSNPVVCYFDEALTILAAQPIRTINGYASNAGTPGRLFIDGTNFSIRVLDKNGTLVVNSSSQPLPAVFTTVSASVSVISPQGTFNDIDSTTGTITTLGSTTGNITTVNATTVNATTVNATTLATTGNTTLGNNATADTVRMNAYCGVGRSASTSYQLVVAGEDSGSTNFAFGVFNVGSTQSLFRVRNDGHSEFQNGYLGIRRSASSNYSLAIEGEDAGATNYALGLWDTTSANNLMRVRNDGLFQVGYTAPESPYLNTVGSGANLYISVTGVLQRSTSSIRYKTDVQNARFGLAEALSLRPVTFRQIRNPDQLFAGFIAEEVDQAGLGVFVEYNAAGQPDALHYGNMTALAIAAIQQQQQIIETLKASVDVLTQQVSDLMQQISAGINPVVVDQISNSPDSGV